MFLSFQLPNHHHQTKWRLTAMWDEVRSQHSLSQIIWSEKLNKLNQNHSHLPIYAERAFSKLYCCPLKFHHDFADCWIIVHHLMPQLDVKVFIAGRTVRCKNVVAGRWKLEVVPIIGLEMVVTPSTTNQLIVLWSQSW